MAGRGMVFPVRLDSWAEMPLRTVVISGARLSTTSLSAVATAVLLPFSTLMIWLCAEALAAVHSRWNPGLAMKVPVPRF